MMHLQQRPQPLLREPWSWFGSLDMSQIKARGIGPFMLRRASAGSSHFLAGGDMNALVPEMGLDCVPQNPLEFTLYITQIRLLPPVWEEFTRILGILFQGKLNLRKVNRISCSLHHRRESQGCNEYLSFLSSTTDSRLLSPSASPAASLWGSPDVMTLTLIPWPS